MIKIRLFYIFWVALPAIGVAQALRSDSIYRVPEFHPAGRALFSIQAGGQTQSTTIPAAFSNRFIDPGFIDDALKASVEDRFKGSNRFGATFSYSASALFFPDSTAKANGSALQISAGTESLFALQFSDDAFSLAFRGNEGFAGKSANLNNSSFYALRYNFFRLSYRKRFETWGFEAGLQAMRGVSNSDVRLDEASLFTDTAGTFLDVRWKGRIRSSSASANAWNNYPSAGAALNLRFIYTPVSQRKWFAEASLSDFGFIQWNSQTNDVQRDTSFRFTGLWFGDIITFNDTNFVIGDSLLSRLRGNEEQASGMQLFPFRVHAAVSFELSPRNAQRLMLQGEYRALPGMRPQFSLGYSRKLGADLELGLDAIYGGFGTLNSRLRLAYRYKGNQLSVLVFAPEGWIAASRFSGNGIFIRYALDI